MGKTKDRRNLETKKKMLGMTVKASNGQVMECIDYVNSSDLTVRFEDGTVIEHVYKCSFLKGTVKNPNQPCRNNNLKKSQIARDKYVGMKIQAKNGMLMECTEYFDAGNITVQFENGSVRTNVGVTEFLQGLVRENKQQKYVGMKVKAFNGQMMECVAYNGSRDLTIKFEDGTVVEHKTVAMFLHGTVKNPNVPRVSKLKEDHTGEQNYTNQGYLITIAEYKDSSDVTVKFGDGLTKKTNLASFRNGGVAYPLSQDLKRSFVQGTYLAQFVFKDVNHAY